MSKENQMKKIKKVSVFADLILTLATLTIAFMVVEWLVPWSWKWKLTL